MASPVTHFLVGAGCAVPLTRRRPDGHRKTPAWLVLLCGGLGMAPDLDLLLWGRVPYAAFLGHRGFFHSPFFALLVATALALLVRAVDRSPGRLAAVATGLAMWLAMSSHAVLDAMTDGGLGVMLLYPFSQGRFFLPWRPIVVAPIGLHALTLGRVAQILRSETPFILAALVLAFALRAWLARGRAARPAAHLRRSRDGG
jgi:inner membrane protein